MRFKIDFRTMKKMFFDRAAVKKRIDVRTRKALSKFGAYVRQTSRRSIKKRKGTAKPGRPPFSHVGTLKRFIFFGYDSQRRSVVIGPTLVPGKRGTAPVVVRIQRQIERVLGRSNKDSATTIHAPGV